MFQEVELKLHCSSYLRFDSTYISCPGLSARWQDIRHLCHGACGEPKHPRNEQVNWFGFSGPQLVALIHFASGATLISRDIFDNLLHLNVRSDYFREIKD